MEAIQTKTCEDCRQEFESLDPKNKDEKRCVSCQVQFRVTGKTAHQRYIETLQKEATNAPVK